jgi:hypothetical protein
MKWHANASVNYSWDNSTCDFNITGNNTLSSDETDWLYIAGLELEPYFFAFVLMFIFFYFADKKNDVLLYFFTSIIALLLGVYYLSSLTILEGIVGLSIIFFSIYCASLGLAYSLGKRPPREK